MQPKGSHAFAARFVIRISTSKEKINETHNGNPLARRRPLGCSHRPDLAVQGCQGRMRGVLRRLHPSLLPDWLRRLLQVTGCGGSSGSIPAAVP